MSDMPDNFVTLKQFDMIDLRIGRVTAAERIEGSKGGKLLKLTVDFGEDAPRSVVSGIGLTFAPDQLVNNSYVFVTNLPPRPMMGVPSHAMILASGDPEHLVLVQPSGPIPVGAKLG